MNTLSIADQAKVSALEGTPSAPVAEVHPGADDKAAMRRAAKDRKNEAARIKRAAKAEKVEHPVAAAAVAAAPKAKAAAKPKPPKAAPVQRVQRMATVTGGAREGAGRKPLYKEAMSKAVTVKLTERQFKAFHGVPEGGTAWLRRGLDELIAAGKRK